AADVFDEVCQDREADDDLEPAVSDLLRPCGRHCQQRRRNQSRTADREPLRKYAHHSSSPLVQSVLRSCVLRTRRRLCLLPPPLWGRVGEGGGGLSDVWGPVSRPPP